MVKFRCVNCEGEVEKNLLPGKHSVLGAVAQINRTAECCGKPSYVDSSGFKENSIDKSLRDLVPSIRA